MNPEEVEKIKTAVCDLIDQIYKIEMAKDCRLSELQKEIDRLNIELAKTYRPL